MNEIDWVIAVVLLVSTILGVSRGVVREVFAILGWVLAIWLSTKYAPELADVIPLPSLSFFIRLALAALGIVVITLFTCGMASKLIGKLLRAGGVSFEDRAIGSIFGFVRGVVIVCVCVFIAERLLEKLGADRSRRDGHRLCDALHARNHCQDAQGAQAELKAAAFV